MYLRPIFLGIFSFLILTVSRGEMISPLKIPLLMSANFGELRPNHFHSGIDLKTQGRIGLPVYAMAQTEGGEGFQESQVIVTGKGGIVPCDVDLVQKQDTEILVELVDIGDGHFLLLVERFHIPEVGGIRLDCFLTVASVAQHLCKECAVPVYDFAEEHVCGAGLLLYPRVPADSQLFRYAVHEVLGILPPFLD